MSRASGSVLVRKNVFFILGCLVTLSVIPCIYLAARQHSMMARSEYYEGTVTAHIPRSGKTTTYALQVTYQDREGVSKTFTSSTASSPPERNIGEKVKVFFDPSTSTDGILLFSNTYLLYWLWFCVCLFAAGFLVGAPLVGLIYRR